MYFFKYQIDYYSQLLALRLIDIILVLSTIEQEPQYKLFTKRQKVFTIFRGVQNL